MRKKNVITQNPRVIFQHVKCSKQNGDDEKTFMTTFIAILVMYPTRNYNPVQLMN